MKKLVQKAAAEYAQSVDSSFPRMALFESLQGAARELEAEAQTLVEGEPCPPGETLSVPRRSGGAPRPVTLLPPPVSVAYTATTNAIGEDVLPDRATSAYDTFRKVGLEGDLDYVVESDIAACYEYIDHSILRRELVKAAPGSLHQIKTLCRLLAETHRRGVGLPQMNATSDRLADHYMANIVRRMQFRGYDAVSFADDFRIPVPSWKIANECIEDLSEAARDVGLVLSQQKTAIWKTASLQEREQAELEFWKEHLAPEGDVSTVPLANPYGLEALLGVKQNVDGACKLIEAWGALKTRSEHGQVDSRLEDRFVTQALLVTADGGQSIDNRILLHFVFYQPHHLNVLTSVLEKRGNADENHGLLEALVSTGRQSAWFKLWTLRLLLDFAPEWTQPMEDWVSRLLTDRHETVRAEAAWANVCRDLLSQHQLEAVYRAAGPLTAHVLAACATRLKKSHATDSMRSDGPLNKAAAKWAEDE